jgi:nucleoid-associated protein YgaU
MHIEIQQPQPFDLVDKEILISGNAAGFEGHLSIYVSEGHDEYTAAAKAGSMGMRQFQASITIPDNHSFKLSRLFVRVADDSGGEEGVEPPAVIIPVLFGPMILPGYTLYWEHKVVSGETLSAIARQYFEGDSSKWRVIQEANQHIVPDANMIFPGQVLRIPRIF